MSKKVIFLISMFILFLAAVTIIYYAVVSKYFNYPDSAGTFGDMFGGLNVILTGLVFILTAYSLYRNESLARETKSAANDQAIIQEINVLIEQIGELHEVFANQSMVSNIVRDINERFGEVLRSFNTIDANEKVDRRRQILSSHNDPILVDIVNKSFDQTYLSYKEYAKLVEYTFLKLNDFHKASIADTYSFILSTKFSKLEKQLIIIFALFYKYSPMGRSGENPFLEEIIKRNFLSLSYVRSICRTEQANNIQFVIRGKTENFIKE